MGDNEIINCNKLLIEINEAHDFIIKDYILDHTKLKILLDYQKTCTFS